MTSDTARFGKQTIEYVFVNDLKSSIENSEAVIRTDTVEQSIDVFAMELGTETVGEVNIHGGSYSVDGMLYRLILDEHISIHPGDDVVVDGHEYVWTLTDVDVEQSETGMTIETAEILKQNAN